MLFDSLLKWFGTAPKTRTDGVLSTTVKVSKPLAPLTLVCISDTHGHHRQLQMPPGDVLIHAGDFTLFGDIQHARDMNDWFGTLSYKHIIVVRGNHEFNAPWKEETAAILSNAHLLCDKSISVEGWQIYGSDFYWCCKGRNPYYDQLMPDTLDVIIAHNPPKGHVDLGKGCSALEERIKEISPAVVVSGHVHEGRGFQHSGKTCYVNAAVVNSERKLTKQPIIVSLLPTL